MKKPVALACSDIHLCHTCPPARSEESNWYDAMARYLHQVDDLASFHQVPVLCSGDVFDRWNSPPELINFAIQNLPPMIAVPGQHDLPNHSLEDIGRAAFWTLVEAGIVQYPIDGFVVLPTEPRLRVFLFPWGVEPCSQDKQKDGIVNVAVCHRYVWTRGRGYPGADASQLAGNIRAENYDVMIFGDNHKTFACRKSPVSKTLILNPGCLIPRKQDERSGKPTVYLIYGDGTAEAVQLDTSQDKWSIVEDEQPITEVEGLGDFMEELRDLETDSLDFRSSVLRWCDQKSVGGRVKELILQSMGE